MKKTILLASVIAAAALAAFGPASATATGSENAAATPRLPVSHNVSMTPEAAIGPKMPVSHNVFSTTEAAQAPAFVDSTTR
ncbi:MAG: hypothetical protein JO006_19220 [Paucibacter sp.]|nr:hypothetical protein [Roseateles sp.]